MAYQSKHTGTAIDTGIDINDTQNSRLTALESKDTTLQNSITSVETKIKNLQNTITELQSIITNLQEQLPKIELNYSIIGGTSQPTASDNLIWINTSSNITDTIFDSITPKNAIEGMIWIITGNTGNASFYMLNANNIFADKIYPVGAKQYIGGTWVQKTGQIYQNGQWITFETMLVINGQYQTDNTMVAYGYGELRHADSFLRSYMPENEYATFEFNKQINTRNYSKAEITINGGNINYNIWFGFTASKGVVPTSVNVNVFEVASVLIPRSGTTVTPGVYTIDLTNINQELWFGFLTSGSGSSTSSTYGYGGIDIISIVLK